MLHITKVIHNDSYVGSVRRALRSACYKQLTGNARETSLRLCQKVKGGCLVRKAPPGATYLPYAHSNEVIIPVDDSGRLIKL